MSLDVRQKIQEFVRERPEYLLYKESEILSIMESEGRISRQELEAAKSTSAFGYGFSSEETEFTPRFTTKKNNSTIRTASPEEKAEAFEYVKEYVKEASDGAKSIYDSYMKDYGPLDMTWNVIKNIANRFDFSTNGNKIITLEEMERIKEKELKFAQRVEASQHIGALEVAFERERGVDFDAKKVLDFKEKSDAYLVALASKEKYELIKDGLKELKIIYAKEQTLERLKNQGQMIPDSSYPEKSFDERLVEILDEYCGNDENLRNEYIAKISDGITSKDELKTKFLEVLKVLEQDSEKLYKEQLCGKSFAQYELEYQQSYQSTFGGENPKEMVEGWVNRQKQGAQFVKVAAIIAATTLTGGSNLMAAGQAKLVQTVGTGLAKQIVKLGMTSYGVGVGVALDYANAIGSQTGLTAEKNQEILTNAKQMLPYAFFGAYVSGPLGDKIASALKTGSATTVMPKILDNAFSKGASSVGFTSEVGLDVLFELAISEGEFVDIITGNATGEAQGRMLNKFFQMLVGGRAHGASKMVMQNALKQAGLADCKVVKTEDGKFELRSSNGETQKFDSVEEILAGTIAKTAEATNEVKVTKKSNHQETSTKVESKNAELEAYRQKAIEYVKKVQSENAKNEFSLRIKDGYSSEWFPDIQESITIIRNRKKMIQALEENPKYVELYRELAIVLKADNKKCGFDESESSIHQRIQYMLQNFNPENAEVILEFVKFIESKETNLLYTSIPDLLRACRAGIRKNITKADVETKKAFYELIKNDSEIEMEETRLVLLQYANEDSYEYIKTVYPYLKSHHKNPTSCSIAGALLFCRTKADADVKLEILKKYGEESLSIIKKITAENAKTAKLILDDNTLSDIVRWAMFGNEEAMKKYQELKDDTDILDSDINTLLYGGKTSGRIELIKNKESIEVYKLFSKKDGFPKELIAGIAVECTEYTKELALMMSEIPDFPPEQIAPILREVKAKDDIVIGSWNKEELTKLNQSVTALLQNGKFPPEIIANTVNEMTKANIDYSLELCNNWQKQELLPNQLPLMIHYKDNISTQQLRKLNRKLGAEEVSKLDFADTYIGAKFADIIDVKNINEIPLANKKEFIRALVDCNAGMFKISDKLKQRLPLLPTDMEQYCGLMKATVKSLGIETNPLTPEQKNKFFNHSMKNLSETMANISDTDFSKLTIEQEFSREDFIAIVREKTKDLSSNERQKVYDYYGFEINHKKGREQRKELTLIGYPVNLNNGRKLAEITDAKTRDVVEALRGDVIKFSERNPIKCNNKQIESFLNEVVEIMPELRSMIGKKQHGTHDFDVMQHSLKVMQKIAQEPNFKQLNESDKKIMFLASLLHDITKAEGISDGTHPREGGFDAYYISKKFNLSREEELKLLDLITHHEWLGNVNRDIKINTEGKTPEEVEKIKQNILTKRLQSVAFDLQHDNLFDMIMLFTHADLKAVKSNNSFHDSKEGDTRAVFDKNNNRIFDTSLQAKGIKTSHGDAAEIYAKRIREYIYELKKTRPLTPTTNVPTMNEIKTHITQINADGSTNIKGVYVDKDGLVVIKVNDVDNWEALGFPAGTTTKGIMVNVNNKGEETHQVETGNFKLMAHGLDYPNQLAKFDAFNMPSSNSMLSITYMERPETKYRNFRPQGIGLDFDSKYIYGGGETDAGSGYGKTVDDFKNSYIFGGDREEDRIFSSDVVKKTKNINDEEYIELYEENKDKSWDEYDDQNLANTLIKAYAENIHSTIRYGDRAYTEYYGSNPKRVNSAWVYSIDSNEKIGNPLEFLNRTILTEGEINSAKIGGESPRPVVERIQFLREFCLNKENDIPMFVFGD